MSDNDELKALIDNLPIAFDIPKIEIDQTFLREWANADKEVEADGYQYRNFHRELFKAVGLLEVLRHGLEAYTQLSMPRYTKESLNENLISWIEARRKSLVWYGNIRLPTSEALTSNPICYVGNWLHLYDLKQLRVGTAAKQNYALNINSVRYSLKYLLHYREIRES